MNILVAVALSLSVSVVQYVHLHRRPMSIHQGMLTFLRLIEFNDRNLDTMLPVVVSLVEYTKAVRQHNRRAAFFKSVEVFFAALVVLFLLWVGGGAVWKILTGVYE